MIMFFHYFDLPNGEVLLLMLALAEPPAQGGL